MIRSAAFLPLTLWLSAAAYAGECDKIFCGLHFLGPEVRAFRPCHSTGSNWVGASKWVEGPLSDLYRANARRPYRPVYVEFRGHPLGEELEGFARDYDGLIRISEVLAKMTVIPPDCRSRPLASPIRRQAETQVAGL